MNDFTYELSLENFQFNYDNMVAEEFFVQSILNLKLRALNESNYIVIQEGFVDTVKKTLRKIFEAVVNFFKKIIGFFRRDKSEIKQLEKDINVLSKKCEKLEKMENQNNKNQISRKAKKDDSQISRKAKKDEPQISRKAKKDEPQISRKAKKDEPQISRMTKKDEPLGLPNYGDKQYDVSYHYARYFFDKYGDAIYDLEELYFNTKIIKVYDTFSDELFFNFKILNDLLSKEIYPNIKMDRNKNGLNRIDVFNRLGKDKNISYDEDTSYEEFGRKYSSFFIVKKGKEFFIENHITLNNVLAEASMVLKDATEIIQETEKKLNTDIKGIDKELETLNRSMDKFKNYEDSKDDQPPIDMDSFKEITSASSKFCSALKGVATIQYIFCNYITNAVSNNVNYVKKYVKEVGIENYINTSGAFNNL